MPSVLTRFLRWLLPPPAQAARAMLANTLFFAQDAALVLALVELDLGHVERAQPLIDRLDAAVLARGQGGVPWQAGIDALRGMALQQRGDAAAARPLLDSALKALADEQELAQPSRLYLSAKRARERLTQ